MTIHKEGYPSLLITIAFIAVLNGIVFYFTSPENQIIRVSVELLSLILFLIILQFFRHPSRNIIINDRQIICPADGKVVVIEETHESEFLKDRRIQVSVFMSPINVHVNRYPVGGIVKYSKYHPGLYLVAWHPKSSTENERTTVVIETSSKTQILMRQIAGALARRIVCYSKSGDAAEQGAEMGFIKFGSRVDLFLPLDTKIMVQLNQKVTGGETVIGEFKS